MQNSKILVATIGAAHSIKGEVRVTSYCHPLEQIFEYTPLTDSQGKEYIVEKYRIQKNILICKFRDIDDRNTSEQLSGIQLFVTRSQLKTLSDEEEFYITDLLNLKVIDISGSDIGTVSNFCNYGAGDILEIEFLDKTKEFFPFTKEIFPVIDIKSQFIHFHAPNISDSVEKL